MTPLAWVETTSVHWELLGPMPYFAVTHTDGTVEEIEADKCQDNGARYLTFVRYRIPFVWTVYTEIARRLDGRAVIQVDEIAPAT